jgi:hypothetical protein
MTAFIIIGIRYEVLGIRYEVLGIRRLESDISFRFPLFFLKNII